MMHLTNILKSQRCSKGTDEESRKLVQQKSRANAFPQCHPFVQELLPYPRKVLQPVSAQPAWMQSQSMVHRVMASATKSAQATLQSFGRSSSGTIIVSSQHYTQVDTDVQRAQTRRVKPKESGVQNWWDRSSGSDTLVDANANVSPADLEMLESMMQDAGEQPAVAEAHRTDVITVSLNVAGVSLPEGARLVWTGNHPALGAWDLRKGVEVTMTGSGGEAQTRLPVGSHEWKLAIVDSSTTATWESGENRVMHLPEAALRLRHLVKLEVSCIMGDTQAISVKTKVYKARLTAKLMTASKYVQSLKARQESLSNRVAQMEMQMNVHEQSVKREAASVVSMRVRKLSESLRVLKAKQAHQDAVTQLEITTESVGKVERKATAALDDAERCAVAAMHANDAAAGPAHVSPPHSRESAISSRHAKPARPSDVVTSATPKSVPARAQRSFQDALQGVFKAALVLATELHPRLRSAAAAVKNGAPEPTTALVVSGAEPSDIYSWMASPAHMIKPIDHAVAARAPLPAPVVAGHDRSDAPDVVMNAAHAVGIAALPSRAPRASHASGKAARDNLATASRHGLFPALCLAWAATQTLNAVSSIRNMAGALGAFGLMELSQQL